jgi:hypothetical protein
MAKYKEKFLICWKNNKAGMFDSGFLEEEKILTSRELIS